MNLRYAKISGVFLSVGFVFLATTVWSATSFHGSAGLRYVQYDATENGKDIFSGNSFVQQYSLSYAATNLSYRNQQNYYNLNLGYDLINFDTRIAQPDTESVIKQHVGRLRYSGDIGFQAAQYPIRFRVYTNDNVPIYLPPGSKDSAALMDDGLAYNISNFGKRVSSGFSLAFEPKYSRNTSLNALPAFYLDYVETVNKISEGLSRIDNKTRKISVAGLNQENNWINFRFLNYEDYLRPERNFVSQQLQIGHVDQNGRRKWSALTNWIQVSADGQLSTIRGVDNEEEYDLNFMAIATRRTWTARTFLNYDRLMKTDASGSRLTETQRVPIYISGVYGPSTDWYMRFSAARAIHATFNTATHNESSYSNTVALGGTTFKRERFTLSPSLSATIDKGFGGTDALHLAAAIETSSTTRYSNKASLDAGLIVKYKDDGNNTQVSQTWNSNAYLTAGYRTYSKLTYNLKEVLTFGDAASAYQDPGQVGTKKYMESSTRASIQWTPNAAFTTSLESLYVMQRNDGSADSNNLELIHRLSYNKKYISGWFDTKFAQRDSYSDKSIDNYSGRDNLDKGRDYYSDNSREYINTGSLQGSMSGKSQALISTGNLQYRPDRYTDAALRYNYSMNEYSNSKSSHWQINEKYSYNFYTRAGVIRNIATVSQEAVYARHSRNASYGVMETGQYTRRYLALSGRYSPLARLSLNGSIRYEKEDPGSIVISYSTGLNADFKLLSTSLVYSYAKRDSDNRIEKKLAASVRRSF